MVQDSVSALVIELVKLFFVLVIVVAFLLDVFFNLVFDKSSVGRYVTNMSNSFFHDHSTNICLLDQITTLFQQFHIIFSPIIFEQSDFVAYRDIDTMELAFIDVLVLNQLFAFDDHGD